MASIYHRATVWHGTATVQIYTGQGLLFGMQLATDGTNDPTITIYNNTSAAGSELIPTSAYEADYQGLNGFTCAYGKYFDLGLHIEIAVAGAGTCEVTVDYTKL